MTFLVERTGERIPCLLNPEGLDVRRSAGIARRRSAGGAVLGNPRTDDPLVATGGGTTDYELKLLFDVDLLARAPDMPTGSPATATTLAPTAEAEGGLSAALEEETAAATPEPQFASDPAPEGPALRLPSSPDVRTLTQPLWSLAENGEAVGGRVAPQLVRFIWGRSWNVPGVILAVAERLERFDSQGVPKRSWLSLLLRRVEEQLEGGDAPPPPTSPQFEINQGAPVGEEAGDESVILPVDDTGMALTPLHMIAAEHYGDPRFDRAIAEYNGLDDLLEFEEGQPIRLPARGSAAVRS